MYIDARVVIYDIKSDLLLNLSDSSYPQHVVREVKRLIFVPETTLANSDVVIGCCMVVIMLM